MGVLVNSLPETMTGLLYVLCDDSSWLNESNVITKSQVAVAKAKGWTSYYYNRGWKEYEGSDNESSSIALPELENGIAAVYTLQGQKVTTPQKGGIYVVNGKKVIVK